MFLLFTIASVVFTSDSSSQEAGPSTPVPNLAPIVAKWQLQRDRLTANRAAVVTYLATSRPPSGKVTEAEFRRLWSQHDLVDSKQLDAVAKMLDATLNAGTVGFAETTLTVADANFRNDVSHGGLVGSMIRHGDVEIRARPRNKQVHIYNAGEMPISSRTLRRLAYLPSGTTSWTDYTTDVCDDNTTKIVSPDGRRALVVDSLSGFVRESSYRIILKDNSALKLVELQSAPFDPNAELLFPRVRASATFRDGVLSKFEICVIVDVELNAEVPASTFAVNASAGTLLLDHRGDVQNPTFVRLDEDSADVLETMDDPQTRKILQKKPKS
ncbi:hypothetical protein [Roseimaritima ulvae]|nr:hypothetical protein [Roseimaritima ulvae]